MRVPWLAFEQRWRDQLCAAILPRLDARALPGIGELDISDSWHRLLESAPPVFGVGVRLAVWILTLAPLLLIGRPRTFAGLRADEQDLVLVRSLSSRWFAIRQMTGALRLAACLCYFVEPTVRSAVVRRERP